MAPRDGPCFGLARRAIMRAQPLEAAMRRAIVLLSVMPLFLFAVSAPAPAADMKSTAPEKMTPPGEARKMRACDDKAMQLKIPMEQKADFVKKCMAEMK
jgi:hypothetical protein